jgi:hypothetical protein
VRGLDGGDLEQRVLAERLADDLHGGREAVGPEADGHGIAGWPVTLNSEPYGVKRPERVRSAIGFSPSPLHSPIRSGRSASAGVSSTS